MAPCEICGGREGRPGRWCRSCEAIGKVVIRRLVSVAIKRALGIEGNPEEGYRRAGGRITSDDSSDIDH